MFFLTGKFPLFQSTDDITALMEIATIIGRKRMEKAATLHSARPVSDTELRLAHSLISFFR